MAEVSVVVPTYNLRYSGLLGRKTYAQGTGEMALRLKVLAAKPEFNPKTHNGRTSFLKLSSDLHTCNVACTLSVHTRLINKTNKLKFLKAKCCPGLYSSFQAKVIYMLRLDLKKKS